MIKTFQKFTSSFSLVIILGLLLVLPFTPSAVDAQTNTNKAKPTTTKSTPVSSSTDQCARLENQISRTGFDVDSQLPKYCSTQAIYSKFITGAFYAVGIVAVIMIIYGGYMYMTAAGSDEQRKKGRTILTWSVVGVIVVILAIILVDVVVKFIVEK